MESSKEKLKKIRIGDLLMSLPALRDLREHWTTLLSRYAVPVLYFILARRGRAAELHREGALAEPAGPGAALPRLPHAAPATGAV